MNTNRSVLEQNVSIYNPYIYRLLLKQLINLMEQPNQLSILKEDFSVK